MGLIEVEADQREIRFRAESGAVEGGLQRLAGAGQVSNEKGPGVLRRGLCISGSGGRI